MDSNLLLHLKKFNQTHLVSYWDQLDHEQRAILIRDIANTDFDHITHAFQGVQDQLIEKSDDQENKPIIDEIMEPIPEHLTGSVDKTSKEQLENYRREG